MSAVLVATASAAAMLILDQDQNEDAAMLYLLAIVVVAMRYGYGAAIVATLLTIPTFDYFFIPPYYAFDVADLHHSLTFGVMLFVALVTAGLSKRLQIQAEAAQRARAQIETEQLRNSLLSSVSHDLRTPLAVMTGAASTLLDEHLEDPDARRDLAESILLEADRLNRLVQNLLDMTRLEAGELRVRKQWQSLEEVVGGALGRCERLLEKRPVETILPEGLPLVPLDTVLVEQVIANLVENATKYSPPGTPLLLVAHARPTEIELEISDRGEGIPPGEEQRIFEKFHRAAHDGRGSGLGLTICRGIVKAHGGRIWAEPRAGGGTTFRFTLPLEGEPPALAPELTA